MTNLMCYGGWKHKLKERMGKMRLIKRDNTVGGRSYRENVNVKIYVFSHHKKSYYFNVKNFCTPFAHPKT